MTCLNPAKPIGDNIAVHQSTKKQAEGWGCNSEVECLPSMCKAVGSTTSPKKKKKKFFKGARAGSMAQVDSACLASTSLTPSTGKIKREQAGSLLVGGPLEVMWEATSKNSCFHKHRRSLRSTSSDLGSYFPPAVHFHNHQRERSKWSF